MTREYKDSGFEWIGKIPETWEVDIAKHVFRQRRDKGNEECQLLAATQKYGMYPQHLLEGVVKVAADTDLSLFKTVHKNDYVISLRSFQGGFEMSDFEGVCSPAYQVFFASRQICNQYYKYLFKSDAFIQEINSLTVGIREGKNILYDDFALLPIPIPTVRDQQRIAEYLDEKCGEIDSLIALQEQMVAQLTDYKQSVITEAVTKGLNPSEELVPSGIDWIDAIPKGWGNVRFYYSNWIRGRLGWKGLKSEEYTESGYPFLSAFNIINNKLDWSDINYINQERYDESPEIKLNVGDILLVKDGAGIGKCARIDELPLGESTVNSSLAVITPKAFLNYKYLYYYLQSNSFWSIINLLLVGMGVPHLTQTNMKNIKMPLPPLEEQIAIAEYLDAKCDEIDKLIETKRLKIETLKEYKKSIIYEAVTGKTDLRDS